MKVELTGGAEALDAPLELRVHGVGGPQAAKMLGEIDEHEVVTLPPFTSDTGCVIPQDLTTRFVRRLHDSVWAADGEEAEGGRTEAYEWGGLTVATAAKALWVLYLPFTLVNAAGWAHAPTGRDDRNVAWVRMHRWLVHVAALLVTLTYVGWLGYLTLFLVSRAWVEHVRPLQTAGVRHDFVLYWVPRLGPAALFLLMGGLLAAPALWGRYEQVREDPATPVPQRWPRTIRISSPDFFDQPASYAIRQRIHIAAAGAATVVLFGLYAAGIHRIGLLLLLLAGVQGVVVLLLTIVDWCARRRVRPSELDDGALLLDAHVDDRGARLPAGATFASVGTCLAHAAFAGLAMTLSPLLARWPSGSSETTLAVGAELGAADVLVWNLVLLLALAGILLARARGETDRSAAGTAKQSLPVQLVRRAPQLGVRALIAFSLPVAFYAASNLWAIFEEEGSRTDAVFAWYDGYDVTGGVVKQLGALVLLALPPLFYAALWRPKTSGAGRVIGNLWDVMTFWPRRFHPLAVPCSAERSVPELRARIRYALARNSLVVVAHSQGSVLSAAAIASLGAQQRAPRLVTFGSPLGTLYTPTWPAYIPSLLVDTRSCVEVAGAQPWVNFWRVTDPVGAEVAAATNRRRHDPQAVEVDDLAAIAKRRPRERPPQWGSVAGHGHYLADPGVNEAIEDRRAP